MNPFDLPGPQFLQFYMFLGCVVLTVLYYARRISESGSIPRIDYSDPYLIAYLRGGEKEAARVAVVSLVDRGLLRLLDDRLEVTNAAAAVRRPIERAILSRAKLSKNAEGLFESASIKAGCKEYQDKLQQLRLLPDKAIEDARTNRLLLALVLLFGVAFIKIIRATMQGRQNIWYLVILAAVFCYFAVKNYNPIRTVLGNNMLADLGTLFASLKARSAMIQSGGATGEVALLLAIFGTNALPASRFPIIRRFEERRRATQTSCGTSGCGSSCSSSSCGGGGGGCGGCGGS
jgi:uncharacterized protein (TIGR04222 family)